jgi:hypothetical protein
MEYQAKVEFRDYLPHPLRNMAELTPRRQLVAEINSSSLYLTDFPVLAKDPNFVENWKRFTELVAANINLVELELQAEFLSQWNQFVVAIESDTSRFTDSALATIPRTLLAEWKNFDFRFLQRVLDKVSSLIYKNFTDMNKELDTSSITEKNVFFKALCKAKNSFEKSKIYTYILYRIFGGSDAKVMNYLENQIAKYFVSNQNGFSNFSLANNQLNKNSEKSRNPENVEEVITEARIVALLKTKSISFLL